jgi:hypothetical protein
MRRLKKRQVPRRSLPIPEGGLPGLGAGGREGLAGDDPPPGQGPEMTGRAGSRPCALKSASVRARAGQAPRSSGPRSRTVGCRPGCGCSRIRRSFRPGCEAAANVVRKLAAGQGRPPEVQDGGQPRWDWGRARRSGPWCSSFQVRVQDEVRGVPAWVIMPMTSSSRHRSRPSWPPGSPKGLWPRATGGHGPGPQVGAVAHAQALVVNLQVPPWRPRPRPVREGLIPRETADGSEGMAGRTSRRFSRGRWKALPRVSDG